MSAMYIYGVSLSLNMHNFIRFHISMCMVCVDYFCCVIFSYGVYRLSSLLVTDCTLPLRENATMTSL